MGASQERHGAGALPVFVIRVRASSYKFQVVNDRLWPVIPLDLDMMTVTGAPRSRSPDIELGTYTSGFVILRQAVILCQLTCTAHSLSPAYSKRRDRLYRYQSTTPRWSEQGAGLLLAKLLLRRSPPCQAPIAITPLASPISSPAPSCA